MYSINALQPETARTVLLVDSLQQGGHIPGGTVGIWVTGCEKRFILGLGLLLGGLGGD